MAFQQKWPSFSLFFIDGLLSLIPNGHQFSLDCVLASTKFCCSKKLEKADLMKVIPTVSFTNLEQGIEMIILNLILTTFIANVIF
jgi:hypothetical protein